MGPGWQRRWAAVDHWLHEGFGNEESPTFHRVNTGLVVLILVSVASVTLETVPALYSRYKLWFDVSEAVVVALFTVEYLVNIYVARDRRAYVLGVWGIIDLLAILPSILLMFDLRALKVGRVLRILRFLRLLRILRVLKLAKVAARQYDKSREQRLNTLKLDLQIYLIALFSAIVIFSTLEFYAEESVANTAYTSIPATMWWCMVTITTTGYGDMAPVTVAGRVIAAATMLSGLALFAILMNVVGRAMLASLFGAANLETHDEVLSRHGPHHATGTAAHVEPQPLACACGQALLAAWRLCPQCGKPTPTGTVAAVATAPADGGPSPEGH